MLGLAVNLDQQHVARFSIQKAHPRHVKITQSFQFPAVRAVAISANIDIAQAKLARHFHQHARAIDAHALGPALMVERRAQPAAGRCHHIIAADACGRFHHFGSG